MAEMPTSERCSRKTLQAHVQPGKEAAGAVAPAAGRCFAPLIKATFYNCKLCIRGGRVASGLPTDVPPTSRSHISLAR